jgi:tellurite resistance-related uncharacterized protein
MLFHHHHLTWVEPWFPRATNSEVSTSHANLMQLKVMKGMLKDLKLALEGQGKGEEHHVTHKNLPCAQGQV